MRGFVVGSLALIVLYVVLQPGSIAAVEGSGNVLATGLSKLLSPDVAAIPVRGGGGSVAPASTGSTTPTLPTPANMPVYV